MNDSIKPLVFGLATLSDVQLAATLKAVCEEVARRNDATITITLPSGKVLHPDVEPLSSQDKLRRSATYGKTDGS